MFEEPRLTLDDLIENVEITSEEPIDEAKARAEFAKYARVLTTDTEISLNSDLDEDAYQSQVRAIVHKAAYFCTIDSEAVATDSSDNYLRIVLDGLDSGTGYEWLAPKQERDIRGFIQAAHADGKVTFEEVIDFLVLTDGMDQDADRDLPRSSINAARLCLEENGIEPTEARINALAQSTEREIAAMGSLVQ